MEVHTCLFHLTVGRIHLKNGDYSLALTSLLTARVLGDTYHLVALKCSVDMHLAEVRLEMGEVEEVQTSQKERVGKQHSHTQYDEFSKQQDPVMNSYLIIRRTSCSKKSWSPFTTTVIS